MNKQAFSAHPYIHELNCLEFLATKNTGRRPAQVWSFDWKEEKQKNKEKGKTTQEHKNYRNMTEQTEIRKEKGNSPLFIRFT